MIKASNIKINSPQSYREILRATSIFGGVQIIQILVQIIRSKVMAILLGPAGFGIHNLLNTTLQLIGSFSNLGLKTSAVKFISSANATGDNEKVSVIIIVLYRWIWITGTIGSFFTLILSSFLSEITFGSKDYSLAFAWISLSLLFNQLSTGQLALLQSLQKIKYLANANLSGAILGLVLTVPLYYFLGIDGIVPAIILSSLANMLRSWYFSNKVKLQKVHVSLSTTINEGKSMLTMGFMLSLSGLMTTGVTYLLSLYISNSGGVEQVGLYSAGFAIINVYGGLVFTAMGTDYYPRLSAVASDNAKTQLIINQQAEITILLLAPIVTFFIIFIPLAIIFLYSSSFVLINNMLQWAAMGMLFKGVSWAIAFIFLAKGESKLFFLNELLTNTYVLIFNIVGYNLGGLDGLGISFLVSYLIYFIQVFIVTNIKYKLILEYSFINLFLVQFCLCSTSFLITKNIDNPYSYFIGIIIIIASLVYSLVRLNQKLDLKKIFSKI